MAGIAVATVRPSTHQNVVPNAVAPCPASMPLCRITAKTAMPIAPPTRWRMLIVVLAPESRRGSVCGKPSRAARGRPGPCRYRAGCPRGPGLPREHGLADRHDDAAGGPLQDAKEDGRGRL